MLDTTTVTAVLPIRGGVFAMLPLAPQPVEMTAAARTTIKRLANTWRGDEEAKLINSSGWQSEVRAPRPG
jgi:hypothetical protein